LLHHLPRDVSQPEFTPLELVGLRLPPANRWQASGLLRRSLASVRLAAGLLADDNHQPVPPSGGLRVGSFQVRKECLSTVVLVSDQFALPTLVVRSGRVAERIGHLAD